ncbi:MAG: hypothetical protein QMC78_01495 [Methanocellales archaeon]|nr:hypothetical protein [Methanocellales archaeon]
MPDNTRMEERTIVVDGDVVVGNHSEIAYGFLAHSVIAGERVKIDGDVIADEEVRLDLWSNVNGDVKTKKNAYLGEKVSINGKLTVKGDLDIGTDVHIEKGFEAKGWITIRNPVPVIVYLFLYLAVLLRLGRGEDVEKILSELFEDEEIPNERAMIIPNRTKVTLDMIRIPNRAIIGDNCYILGNLRANSLEIGDNSTLFGSIRTKDGIKIGQKTKIHGGLVTKGAVHIGEKSQVMGEIDADVITIHEEAKVDGAMRSLKGVFFARDEEDGQHEDEFISLDV